MLCHDTLVSYYTLNFTIKNKYQFSIDELENMFPYERDIYVMLIEQSIKEENDKVNKS